MSDSNDEVRQKLIDLLQEGKVAWNPAVPEGYTLDTDQPDFTVTDVKMTANRGENGYAYIELQWCTVSAGFGVVAISIRPDGTVVADTEGMGKGFCMKLFGWLVDHWSGDVD